MNRPSSFEMLVEKVERYLRDSQLKPQEVEAHTRFIQSILKDSARVDAPDGEGLTPLMHACRAGYVGIVKMLLWYGADPNYQVAELTPLRVAVNANQSEIVALLLLAGAQLDSYITRSAQLSSEMKTLLDCFKEYRDFLTTDSLLATNFPRALRYFTDIEDKLLFHRVPASHIGRARKMAMIFESDGYYTTNQERIEIIENMKTTLAPTDKLYWLLSLMEAVVEQHTEPTAKPQATAPAA